MKAVSEENVTLLDDYSTSSYLYEKAQYTIFLV